MTSNASGLSVCLVNPSGATPGSAMRSLSFEVLRTPAIPPGAA
jgi:hypothetical protein